MKKIAFRLAEAVVVGLALAVLTVRFSQGDAYEEYRRSGGRNGFWSWFAKEKCGVSLPGVEDLDAAFAEEKKAKEKARAKAAQEAAKAKLAELEKREKELVAAEAKEKRRLAAVRKMLEAKKGGKAGKPAKGRSFSGSGGTVRTGGKSSYRPAAPGQPYRVNGIQGIEFGSTDNAPGEGVQPLLSVSYDADGNAQFKALKWRQSRKLSDPIYGFENAILDHTYESGQLSRVTLTKSFPLDEQGMRQAVAFYASMSAL